MNVQIRKREFRQKTYTTYTEPASALKTLSCRGVGSVEPTDTVPKTYTPGTEPTPGAHLRSPLRRSGFNRDPHPRSLAASLNPDPAVAKHRDHAFECPAERFWRFGKAWSPDRIAGFLRQPLP